MHPAAATAISDARARIESMGWRRVLLATLTVAGVTAGVVLRLFPLVETGVPPAYAVNGGGLYVAFVDAIQANGFRYPTTIEHYKTGGVPFAYPPLFFYVAAVVTTVTPVSTFGLLQTLPFVFAALTVPAIAVVSYRLLDLRGALVSTVVYGLTPEAYEPFVTGEGLIEAASALAFILCLLPMWRLATASPTRKRWAVLGVAVGVAVMVGPASLVAVPLAALAFAAAAIRSIERLRAFVLAGALSVGVSSVWWLPVLGHHGVDVFLTSSGTKTQGTTILTEVANTGGLRIPVLAGSSLESLTIVLLVAAGMVYCAIATPRFVPLVVLLPFLARFREPAFLAWVPIAILIAIGTTRALPRLLRPWFEQSRGVVVARLRDADFVVLLVLVVVVASTIGPAIGTSASVPLSQESRAEQSDARASLEWVGDHAPADAQVLVITSNYSFLDWAPVWADRTVINVYQGGEWTGDHDRLKQLNFHLGKAASPGAVDELLNLADLTTNYDYVVVTPRETNPGLVANFSSAGEYRTAFESENAIVFRRTDSAASSYRGRVRVQWVGFSRA